MQQHEIEFLKDMAKKVRRDIVDMAYWAQGSHVASALSIADIVTALYFNILNINKDNILSKDRDKFILSKGHASSALYAVLCEKDFFDRELLKGYYKDASPLSGHPKLQALKGIEASTGSLGHGINIGIGMALADKADGRESRTVVLMGDGECNEGSIWEGANFAVANNVSGLTVIVDSNRLQGYGRASALSGGTSLKMKFEAFGWDACECDGHNFNDIALCMQKAKESNKPFAIIANTVKGKGVSFMEDRLEWHYKSPKDGDYKKAMEELS